MKRFSKIFAVVIAVVMLVSTFVLPTSAAYLSDATLDLSVRLEKVTETGFTDVSGLEACENNIYKLIVSMDSSVPMWKIQTGVFFDTSLFDVCWYDVGTSELYFDSFTEPGYYDIGYSPLGVLLDANSYTSAGATGASGKNVYAYGPSHSAAKTSFYGAQAGSDEEVYKTAVKYAYTDKGETVPADAGFLLVSYTYSIEVAKGIVLPTGKQDLFEIYLHLKDGKTAADIEGTEFRLSNIDYSADGAPTVAGDYNMWFGKTTSDPSTVGTYTQNGTAFTYTTPSPVYAKGSQIRFNGLEENGAKASFDVRTRAALTAADFAAICGSEDNAKALAEAGKLQVGFVYTAGTMDVATAKAVATGTAASGYYNKPVTYIQSTGTEYVWTCLIKNADYDYVVQALGYIIVDGTPYYFDAASTTTFSTLYDAWYDDYAATKA